jgi:hypothetical protein
LFGSVAGTGIDRAIFAGSIISRGRLRHFGEIGICQRYLATVLSAKAFGELGDEEITKGMASKNWCVSRWRISGEIHQAGMPKGIVPAAVELGKEALPTLSR